ncbi:MAG: ATP-binding protein [Saprospiraceae bacterium]
MRYCVLSAFLVLFLPFSACCQSTHYFENPIILDSGNGVAVGDITSVVVDSSGFLWIAGEEGLQRFDGNHFKLYLHDPIDSLSLIGNDIRNLFYDEEKNQIWISTWDVGGLSILDLRTEKFKNYFFDPSIPGGLTEDDFYWTYKDNFGNYWISVATKGLLKYLPESDTFEPYSYQPLPTEPNLNFNSVNRFQSMAGDIFNDSLLWIGTGDGLLKFNVLTRQFERYSITSNYVTGLQIRSVFFHQNNRIYVGTWGAGLFSFDPKTGLFAKCNLEGYAKVGTPSNNIIRISAKSKEQLLITTNAGMAVYDISKNKVVKSWLNDLPYKKLYGVLYTGKSGRKMVWRKRNLFIYDPVRQQIKPYRYQPGKGDFNFIVRRILEDDNTGKLWVAAQFSEGLYRVDLRTGVWETFLPPKKYFDKRANFNCWDVLKTKQGELLVLDADAIYRLSEEEKKLVRWELQPQVKGASFKRMMGDSNGNIWIGSDYDGVFKINPVEKTIRHYKKELLGSDKQHPGAVWDLREDRNGNIWIRCQGYSVYDARRDTFFNFPYFFTGQKIVEHVESLGIDGDGNVWVASHKGSIGITDADHPENGIVEYFDKSKGLQTQKPVKFLLDKDKNVWITSYALEKINPQRNASTYYKPHYLGNEYLSSISQLSDGRVAVGFRQGIGIFHPDSLKTNLESPKPYVRSFKVFDKELETGLPLYQTRDVYLSPNQNFFSLEITAINPSYFGVASFLYKLEGVDPDWVDPGSRNYIAYTDVGSGMYVFKLKARSEESILNETPYELRIHIATPWYQAWWAYTLFAMLILGIAFSLYRFQLSRKLAQQEAQRLKELDVFKTRFYSNITHEFRTPLTVIHGMADELENHPQKEPQKKLNLIKKNSRSLLYLVNQMLDLSKLQAGKVAVDLRQGDVIIFIQYLVEAHESMAKTQNAGLQFYTEERQLAMDFDAEKLERVLTNLISNAIKFTPEHGKILVVAKKVELSGKPFLQILVKDNGIGISAEQLPFIFDRFHQANPANENQGTGIGLALVKELVGIMNGTVQVESEPGKGSAFSLTFPIQNKAPLSAAQGRGEFDTPSVPVGLKEPEPEPVLMDGELPILLIIEDNIDVIYYLKSCLEDQYQILTCRNGKDGIEKALEVLPDIIISDVMMPQNDGFEVCATLKEDERTSHIPIILLTAKATSEDKLTGLTRGADAYLIKPFEKAELMIRLDKLMEIRQTLQKKYSGMLMSNKTSGEIPAGKEGSFMEKIENAIIEHLEEEDFSVNELARALRLSRSQVHRKIKALTGMSTAIYIRHVRLQKAKEWLISDHLTISEVAYKVGFKSPVYFSQVFKETFGESPSATRK